jgi:hypothetical protein
MTASVSETRAACRVMEESGFAVPEIACSHPVAGRDWTAGWTAQRIWGDS